MRRPAAALVLLGLALLPGGPATASGGDCPTRVDDDHALRASGSSARVRTRPNGHKVLVLRDVGPSGRRVSVEDGDAVCAVRLARFEKHWTRLTYELHARLRGPSGSWAVRVRFVDYDPDRRVLRARGRLTDHRSAPRQTDPSWEIVYASTFVPFDSSF
jgi:hypothetical protein